MRIVVHGQQAFGKSVLESLLERRENVVGVYCAPDPAQCGRVDPLKEAALARNLPVFQPRSFRNKPEVLEEFSRLKADLCVMAYVTLIVPESVLYQPTRGTNQYHPSLLPKHRGPSSINWPIIMGEKRTGLTIFWPDQGLDTGPILLHDAKKLSGAASGQPGEVVAIDDTGITVAAAGGRIQITRVRPEGGQKVAAAAFAKTAGLRPGVRLGGEVRIGER